MMPVTTISRPKTVLLLAVALLFLMAPGGCDYEFGPTEPKRRPATVSYRPRLYQGHLYRTYYIVSSGARFLTLRFEQGQWRSINGDQRLADDVETRGTYAGDEVAPSTSTSQRFAAGTVIRRLYVLSSAKDEMVTADPDTGTILTRTPLTRPRPFTLASLSNDPRIFVLHQAQPAVGTIPASSPGITVFDKSTRRIILNRALPAATIPNGEVGSLALAETPAGKRLYLANNGEPSNTGGALSFPGASIEVLDPDTLSTLASIPTPQSGIAFNQIVASPDGTLLYGSTGTRLVAIDTLTNTVSAQIAASGSALVFHPNGRKLYYSRRTSIGIVDTATATSTLQIPIPGSVSMQQLVITPDGIDLFAQDDRANKLFQLDLAQNTVTTFPSTGANQLALAP